MIGEIRQSGKMFQYAKRVLYSWEISSEAAVISPLSAMDSLAQRNLSHTLRQTSKMIDATNSKCIDDFPFPFYLKILQLGRLTRYSVN